MTSLCSPRKAVVGLVVPSLEQGGGVPAVAEFIWQAVRRSERFEAILVSLDTNARSDLSVSVGKPSTWLRGAQTRSGVWRDRPFTRVGSFASELEFQRYRPRAALSRLLAGCDLIQVVCGFPAWANSVVWGWASRWRCMSRRGRASSGAGAIWMPAALPPGGGRR